MEIAPPKRVTRSYVQHLLAEPARVFPLLCPVREAEWIEGWDPISVWSESGVVEKDCVFVTSSADGETVWYVTRHLPEQGEVEMVRITPGLTACGFVIKLAETPAGTDAEITYKHTSLGPAGDAFVDAFTEERFTAWMREWESRLNHYLTTGAMLRA